MDLFSKFVSDFAGFVENQIDYMVKGLTPPQPAVAVGNEGKQGLGYGVIHPEDEPKSNPKDQ